MILLVNFCTNGGMKAIYELLKEAIKVELYGPIGIDFMIDIVKKLYYKWENSSHLSIINSIPYKHFITFDKSFKERYSKKHKKMKLLMLSYNACGGPQ
jgi:hypothetical protein